MNPHEERAYLEALLTALDRAESLVGTLAFREALPNNMGHARKSLNDMGKSVNHRLGELLDGAK